MMHTIPMYPQFETILGVLPGATDRDRVLIIKEVTPVRGVKLELRQQTFGEGVGWFTQVTLPLTPDQASELRCVLSLVTETKSVAQRAAERGLALVP
ncbi:MAG: hypothetical protein VB878_08560 [Pirellulaceae bacterium]|jgi:hypothetical protein